MSLLPDKSRTPESCPHAAIASLAPHYTVKKDQGSNSKAKALAYSQAPRTGHWQVGRGLWGVQSAGGLASGDPWLPSSLREMAGFICHARGPGKCSPHMKQLLHPGIWELPFRKEKILHTVSIATGLSEQSAWLCTLVRHTSQTCGDPRGA